MVRYWRDACGTVRYGGRNGRRRRRRVRNLGLFVCMRLQTTNAGSVRLKLTPDEANFPQVSLPQDVAWCPQNGRPYHTTIKYAYDLAGDPYAQQCLAQIHAHMAGHAWYGRIRINYVSPHSHVACVHFNCPMFAPMWSSMTYLRNNYGGHGGNQITISL